MRPRQGTVVRREDSDTTLTVEVYRPVIETPIKKVTELFIVYRRKTETIRGIFHQVVDVRQREDFCKKSKKNTSLPKGLKRRDEGKIDN